MEPSSEWFSRICASEFCEPLLEWLGAERVESIDISDYQGASRLHDLNSPLPSSFYGRYTLLLDSGTLEHVFNFPEALRSCISMLRPGGVFLAVTPANNFMGHGFYQFSPELLFGAFERNSFVDSEAFLVTRASVNGWYKCPNPKRLGSRVLLSSLEPTFMMFMTRKGCDLDHFAIPQQSDYEDVAWVRKEAWSGNGSALAGAVGRLAGAYGIARRVLDVVGAIRGLWGRKKFTAFDPAKDRLQN